MASRSVRIPIPSSSGQIILQGALFTPSDNSNARCKLAMMCHPWSWLGGSMNDHVLHLLTPVFLRHSFTVLRFNSRGVGGSTGSATLRGEGEVADLQQVVRWGLEQLGGEAERVVLLGYSHGSLITSRHLPLPDIPTSHILVSYPISVMHWLTLFSQSKYRVALEQLVKSKQGDVLTVYGDRDNFSGEGVLDKWAGELHNAVKAEGNEGGKVKTEKVHGADHFWGGDEGEILVRIVDEWLRER